MKRIVRLTESDLTRIVKRVIKESLPENMISLNPQPVVQYNTIVKYMVVGNTTPKKYKLEGYKMEGYEKKNSRYLYTCEDRTLYKYDTVKPPLKQTYTKIMLSDNEKIRLSKSLPCRS
jgi:hypothetical protein